MKLSVVIPCFNGASTVTKTLDSLAIQQWNEDWEIVFSDNGSTDQSRSIAESYIGRIPHLRIVDTSSRSGQPYALNSGIKAALGESIVLCDADDVPAEGWLSAMGEALEKHDLVACRMVTGKINPPWAETYRINSQYDSVRKIHYPPYLYHAAGATLGFKKKLYDSIGGFDEALPYLHDTDFCFRAQLAGINIHFVKDAVIYYRLRTDLEEIFKQAKNYGEYNIILYKRYLNYGNPPKDRWKRFFRTWKSLFRVWLRNTVHKGSVDNGEAARFKWKLGWEIGRVKGIIKCFVPPY